MCPYARITMCDTPQPGGSGKQVISSVKKDGPAEKIYGQQNSVVDEGETAINTDEFIAWTSRWVGGGLEYVE